MTDEMQLCRTEEPSEQVAAPSISPRFVRGGCDVYAFR